MSKRNKAFVYIGIALATSIIVIAIITDPAFQDCLNKNYEQYNATKHYDITTYMFFPIGVCGRCVGAFFHVYSDTLTALATIVIAWFTVTLSRTSRSQGQISHEQNRILEKQVLFEHGAHIKVVEVELIGHLIIDRPVAARVCLINVGASDAQVISGNITITIAGADVAPWRHVESDREVADPYQPPFDFFLNSKQGPIVEAGMQTLPFSRERRMYLSLPESLAIKNGKQAVWLVGFVFYKDCITSRKRKTGFCRRLTEDSTRFRTFAEPDLEYEY